MVVPRELYLNEHEHEFYDIIPNTLRSYRDERKPPNYTNEQLIQLEESYNVNPYLSMRALINLARKLWINEANVRLWYRKRRSNYSESNNDILVRLIVTTVYESPKQPSC